MKGLFKPHEMLKNYSRTQFEPDDEGTILQNIESYSPNNKSEDKKLQI
jgi:hypothetical protein